MGDLIKAINDLGQNNYWDYMQFGVNVISTITAVITLIFAIRIPVKIAKSQNDIALFEKRNKLYRTILPLVCFGKDLLEIEGQNLKKIDRKTRARHYLMMYIMANGRDFDEIINIGLNFKVLKSENEFLGYEISHHKIDDMYTYKLQLKQRINASKAIIEQSSFLFKKDIEDILKKMANSYYLFMILVSEYSELENNDVYYASDEVKEFEFQNCSMERNKREFLKVIKELSNKNVLEQIEGYLRIKE